MPPLYVVSLTTFMIIFVLAFSSSFACNNDDKTALLTIKNSFPPNSFPQSWTSTDDCCAWNYIRCSRNTGRVRYLVISNNENLSGIIPSSIGDLPFLEVLGLNNLPNLVGPIPPQLSKLTKLHTLHIQNTSVSGPVPSFLTKLPILTEIKLDNNKLTGNIPVSLDLSQLVSLSIFTLSGNQLTGRIPPLFFRNTTKSLVMFALDNNLLTGDIPPSFGNILIEYIDLSNNQLTGNSAGVLFGKFKPTFLMMLANNTIKFDLSKVLFPENITYLDLSHNKIYGSIPEQITELSGLDTFDVSYNSLCGMIPSGGHSIAFPSYQGNKCLCGSPLPACK